MSGYTEIDTPEKELPPIRVFDITYVNPAYTFNTESTSQSTITETQSGYLSVTPDFVALSDKEGMLTFFMPSHRVVKAVATGIVETPTGPVN